jgi:gamma-glutamyl-gamma-aminobutyraldehyde dehydrogenase
MLQNEVNALRDTPVATPTMIIGGQSVAAHSGQTLEVSSPVDGQTLTHIPNAGEHDVAAAVAAARTSFDAGVWARIAPAERKKILLRWAELIELNALELAVLGVRDNGTEMSMAFKAEPLSAAGTIRYYAEAIDKIYGEVAPTDPSTLALILKEPVGVVGAIVPWNFPLMISAWKIAPALAMGNSVVLKPSEVASLSVLRMVALAHEAGLPEGVLNVITGEGPVSGRALARSMDVDALVFTGSVNVGRRLMEYAAQSNLKRVFLELGGKSPHIVFDDTQDIDTAAQAVVNGIFRNSGQVCIAGSRLLVQDTIHDALVDKIITLSEGLRVGDPLDLSNQIGAVSSEEHLQRILTMLKGNDSIATGGARILADTGGSYMQPTVVLDQQPDDPLVRNEIFGPVLTVTRFKKETDAVEMANASELGLAAGVWTNELGRAHRMISALRAGVVHVNTFGGADNTVPLGGFKQSGNGHDKSLHAIEKFINKKTAWIKL